MARVYLTGRMMVAGPDRSFDEVDLPGVQGRIAFAVLIRHRQPIARDALAELLWNEGDLPEAWGSAVNSLMSKIRRLLSDIGENGRDVLRQVGGSYQAVIPADWWIDLEEATARLDRAEGASRHDEWETAVADATVAAGIYCRPFLAGSGGLWVERERRHLDDALYRSYEVLARGWRRRGDPALAAAIATRAVELDPLRESGHRLLIEAEEARGDRGAALRAYRRCAETLRVELGVDPSDETVELGRRVGADAMLNP